MCLTRTGADDTGLHDPLAQTYAEDLLQEASTSSCARGASIRRQGHVDNGCAHRYEVEQVPLEQWCAQRAPPRARAPLAQAQRG
eukprot:symbB.v1.2.003763.t1/scaffold207.1/size268535/10